MKEFLPSIPDKGIFFVAVTQFGNTFSINFVTAFMPFYILKISPFGLKETLIWIGLIMAAPSVIAALMAPIWGGFANKIRPKLLYQGAILSNTVITLLHGFAGNLYLLLFLRAMLGIMGGSSTVGLVLTSALSPSERLHKNLSLFQICLTIGQLVGPPMGAFMVTLAGYRVAFIFASLVVGSSLVFCHRYVEDVPCQKIYSNPGRVMKQGIFWGWALGLIATIHITYMPSILPHILENFQLKGETALKSAGIIMMAYSVTAILGNYLINNLAPRAKLRQVVMYVCLSAAFLQALMYISKGVFSFTLIRMLQTGAIAAVFPMILSVFATGVGGGTLGFLNSARFAGNAIGPMIATSLVAYSNLPTLYLIITGLTIIPLIGFLRTTGRVPSEDKEE
jgi:DHA1 family multidrug resistance protein-like MFS transporter